MRRKSWMIVIAVLAILTAAAFGCSSAQADAGQAAAEMQDPDQGPTGAAEPAVTEAKEEPAGPEKIEVQEESGKTVSLDGPAQKVVVFAPSALEIIDALGAKDKVIGVDNWSIDMGEPLAEGFEGYGDFQGVNMEKIAQSMPDLIIAVQGGPVEDLDRVEEEFGIAVYSVNAESIERVYQEIQNIGIMIGSGQEAQALAENLKSEVQEIYSKVADIPQEERPTVFYQIFDDPLWTVGEATFINDLIVKAGGVNIVAFDGLEGYVEYNVEKLIEHDPQVMIAGDGGMVVAKTADVILDDPRFASVSAVVEGRVYVVTENFVVRPNQNIIKGLKMFAMAIHPEIFGEFERID